MNLIQDPLLCVQTCWKTFWQRLSWATLDCSIKTSDLYWIKIGPRNWKCGRFPSQHHWTSMTCWPLLSLYVPRSVLVIADHYLVVLKQWGFWHEFRWCRFQSGIWKVCPIMSCHCRMVLLWPKPRDSLFWSTLRRRAKSGSRIEREVENSRWKKCSPLVNIHVLILLLLHFALESTWSASCMIFIDFCFFVIRLLT